MEVKSLIVLLCLLLTSTLLKAQYVTLAEESFLADSIKKRGVYRSFEDFQQNAPSFRDSFFLANSPIVGQKILKQANPDGKESLIKGKIWGYCNGADVYVKNKQYYMIHDYGHICLYTVRKMKTHADLSIGDVNFIGSEYEYVQTYFIDFKSGVSKKLKKGTLIKYILSKDTELLRMFNRDESYPPPLEEYVRKFNERNNPY